MQNHRVNSNGAPVRFESGAKCGWSEHRNEAFDKAGLRLAVIFAAILLMSAGVTFKAIAGSRAAQVCDVDADYALGLEDYRLAIRRHTDVLRLDPDNALAHYHLGFAQGMEGNRAAEINEYQRAETLA